MVPYLCIKQKQVTMKTNLKSTLKDSLQTLFPDSRLELTSLIQTFDLELVRAARK